MPSPVTEDFRVNQTKPVSEKEFSGYTLGAEPIDPENTRCVARFVKGETGTAYFVKYATRGIQMGSMFNPWGFAQEDLNRFWSDRGSSEFQWRKVSRDAYDQYLLFLKTGNESRLRNAQRVA